jgi:hypothetical protein
LRPEIFHELAVARQGFDVLAGLDRAGADAAGEQAAEEGVGLQRGGEHAERAVLDDRRRDVLQDEVEEGADALVLGAVRGGGHPALLGGAVEDGEVELLSLASSAANRSKMASSTKSGRASGLSTLLMTTMGFRPMASALESTNLVCGIGPSAASTRMMAPSTMLRMRSTSPPKSAWPGVSTMLMRASFQRSEVTLARMVMPRSFSSALESMARSATCWPVRKEPEARRSTSMRVVLPWSTWAMMATLRGSRTGGSRS